MESLHRRAPRTPRRRWAARCVLAGTTALLVATGSTTALAQPTTTPAVPTTAAPSTPATSSTPDVPATTERVKPAAPPSADRQVPDTPSVPTEAVPSSSPATAPPGAEPSLPADRAPADPPSAAPTRKAPAGEWTPTENPNPTVVPGKMRSDREEIPEGFTKEQADLAETMEAQQQSSRMSLMSLPCTTYWPAPFLVCGEIRVKYESLGGPNSFLKWPINNELTNPDGVGKRSEFMVGPIYWHPTTGAHPVVNSFMTKWGSHGWEGGFIGYPTTDEIVNPDGIGRRQEFQNAAIYWHPLTTINGAVIGGAIRDKWNTLGAETNGSRLGYPTSDELVNTDTVGRRQSFAGGLMYWSPSTGAHPVTGVVQAVWSFKNYEIGEYGYPVDDGVFGPDGNRQEFQHGGITFGLPVDASGKTGVYLNGCHLMTGNPHVSGHKPWTIDTETEGNCSQPKRYIQATTFIWKVNTGADCGRGMCEIDAGTAMGSAGDGETIQENLRFRFTSARQCEEADFFAATEWEMTNADGSHWEDIIVTDTFHLGGPERPCAEAPEDYVPEPLIPGGGGGSW